MVQHGGIVYYGGLYLRTVGLHRVRPAKAFAALATGGHPGAERGAGFVFWTLGLPDEWLLLWPAHQSAVGHPIPGRPRDLPTPVLVLPPRFTIRC